MNYLLSQGLPNEEKAFIIPILGAIAKLVPILGGVAAGVSAYQQIRESPGGLRVQPPMKSLGPGGGLMTIPRTRSEIERGQGFGQAIQPGWQTNGAGGGYYRRRRMNVLNPRALSRSIRRVKGFAKFAKRVGSFTDPGKGYRLKGFGRKKARR